MCRAMGTPGSARKPATPAAQAVSPRPAAAGVRAMELSSPATPASARQAQDLDLGSSRITIQSTLHPGLASASPGVRSSSSLTGKCPLDGAHMGLRLWHLQAEPGRLSRLKRLQATCCRGCRLATMCALALWSPRVCGDAARLSLPAIRPQAHGTVPVQCAPCGCLSCTRQPPCWRKRETS